MRQRKKKYHADDTGHSKVIKKAKINWGNEKLKQENKMLSEKNNPHTVNF